MITRDLTNLYLHKFNFLVEELYLCWYNSYSVSKKQIDENVLREQIRSYGFYPYKSNIRKEFPIPYRNKLTFKSLTWVNDFTKSIGEDSLCACDDLAGQVIAEIENNLFKITNKADKIAYANVILRDLDKSRVHNKKLDETIRRNKYREIFEYVLNHNFITEDNVTLNENSAKVYPIYSLTVRLINHLEFIDKLIDLFQCFDINLILLNNTSHYNLCIFDEKTHLGVHANRVDEEVAVPKFNSDLSDDCLIKIMLFLKSEQWLENPNSDNWLFWFNRKPLVNKSELVWKGTPTMLSNVIQHLCTTCVSNTIKVAFATKDYVKPTRSDYRKGNTYKKIEQIIIVSNKK